MKRFVCLNRLSRLSAIVLILLLCVASAIKFGLWEEFSLPLLSSFVLSACVIMSLFPLSYESRCSTAVMQGIGSVVLLLLALPARTPSELFMVCALWIVGALSIFNIYRCKNRFSLLPSLLLSDCLWRSVEDTARFFYSCLLYLSASLMLCLPEQVLVSPVGGPLLLVAALSLLVVLWIRARSGKTCFLSSSLENRIRTLSLDFTKGELSEKMAKDSLKNELYQRICAQMDKSRPYLNPSLSVGDLSSLVGVNKTYLSQVINACSGKNFCQFVNSYRIQYAVHLLDEEPNLKIMEVAIMSGFHTVVSFNMAFKLLMKMTPGEYIRGRKP